MEEAAAERRSRRQLGLLWGGVAAALVALSPFATRLAAALPACPFKSLTGLPCPGCGATRAALALSRLDVATAFAVSPLAAAAWTGLVAGGLLAGAWSLTGRALPAPPRLDGRRLWAWRVAVGTAVVGNWLYLLYAGT